MSGGRCVAVAKQCLQQFEIACAHLPVGFIEAHLRGYRSQSLSECFPVHPRQTFDDEQLHAEVVATLYEFKDGVRRRHLYVVGREVVLFEIDAAGDRTRYDAHNLPLGGTERLMGRHHLLSHLVRVESQDQLRQENITSLPSFGYPGYIVKEYLMHIWAQR